MIKYYSSATKLKHACIGYNNYILLYYKSLLILSSYFHSRFCYLFYESFCSVWQEREKNHWAKLTPHKMIKGLDKKTLTTLYVKEKLSLRAIAKMFERSYFLTTHRRIQYGIKMRPWGLGRKIRIEKSILQKLYVKEGKSSNEVAEILPCSYTTVFNRCKEYGISIKAQRFEIITKEVLQKIVRQGKKQFVKMQKY